MFEVKKLKKITTFTARNDSFLVVRDELGNFWSINEKLINEEGKLDKALNGLKGHISGSLNGSMNAAAFDAEWNYWESKGNNMTEIINKMMKFKYPFPQDDEDQQIKTK